MTPADILTEQEAAELMRVRPSTVRALGRRGLIRRIPPARPPRYDRGSVVAYLDRGLYAVGDEPNGEASTQEAPPRRGNGGAPQGSLAGAAVGGSGALHRRIGPTAGDVAIRRVPR